VSASTSQMFQCCQMWCWCDDDVGGAAAAEASLPEQPSKMGDNQLGQVNGNSHN